jgi:MFS family permease
MVDFLLRNLRWLGAGLLLTFGSSFGQTWFIALFAGGIRAEHGLSDGGWGTLYSLATLCAAGLLLVTGGLADTARLARLAPAVALVFAGACLGMAFGGTLWLLGLSLLLLRFCGQGMFSHIAMTAMGRWFRARRGQAVAITSLGYSAGEIVLPPLTLLVVGAIGWHATWAVAAALLALVAAPLLAVLLASRRQPFGTLGDEGGSGLAGRHWSRRDAVGHWLFPMLLPIVLTPPFIGTVVFFQQVHIAGVKGWSLAQMAPGYTAFATLTITAGLATGWAADRLGPQRILPVLLLPMAAGVTLIGPAGAVWTWFLALGLLGITQGMQGALWGALLPAVYGTRHLGSVRSLVTTIMVVSTAVGPAITGILIDGGIDFPRQAYFLGGWCLLLSLLGLAVARRIAAELAPEA